MAYHMRGVILEIAYRASIRSMGDSEVTEWIRAVARYDKKEEEEITTEVRSKMKRLFV